MGRKCYEYTRNLEAPPPPPTHSMSCDIIDEPNWCHLARFGYIIFLVLIHLLPPLIREK